MLSEMLEVRSEELLLKNGEFLTLLFPKYELHLQNHVIFFVIVFLHKHKYLKKILSSEKSPGKAIQLFSSYISINVFTISCLKSL